MRGPVVSRKIGHRLPHGREVKQMAATLIQLARSPPVHPGAAPAVGEDDANAPDRG